ncbi:MAG: hypothetical protein IJ071_03555 [Ruminococcus sp.]|nr:hypothetical protein [Ruminococcus sp.]
MENYGRLAKVGQTQINVYLDEDHMMYAGLPDKLAGIFREFLQKNGL